MKAIVSLVRFSLLLVVCTSSFARSPATQPARELVATEGKGYLEKVDDYLVLHLKGTPEEMGYQHGVLLKDHVRENMAFLLDQAQDEEFEVGGFKLTRPMIAAFLNTLFADKVPERFVKEMTALARGADLPGAKVIAANLIPELFHCSGFALLKEATATGKLYHGRVLDYGVDWRLQEHAVLIIQEPDGRIPFVNVSYAGFIGSVTGMNAEQIGIGEMGGRGEGKWQGIPMSFLVRMVLEQAATLDQAIGVFQDNPRTCEYYYVISDARADSAVGMKAVPEKVELIRPGAQHPLLPNPVKNTVLMSAGDRYKALSELVAAGYGNFTEQRAVRLMDAPVAMKENLHDVLMVPADGVLYVANAARDQSPAWKQKYYRFNWLELMKKRPG
ncbi:MAG TPA: C45 family autoproteolytic acyltransferase/hydrolase [Phycisphaerae bacterium]|nr:C45 family autoproteolytic acyltransferase/hydrolase [Phycisphaerae bacterium]HRY66968.1 C45 family autoproteolytic acyltransferase/hydrolase [Phycisphaerae bacterium]HSA29566.1 C45 family autoproteolytic acyltransferase/hydrolase [Phycisphaerae bacterium]